MYGDIQLIKERSQRFINEAETARMVRLARSGRPALEWRTRLAKLFRPRSDTISTGHRDQSA